MAAAQDGGECSAAHPGRTLPPGKTRYPLYWRLGGPQGRSGRAENLVPTGIRSWTVQPVVSRYTDWDTRPTNTCQSLWKWHVCLSKWHTGLTFILRVHFLHFMKMYNFFNAYIMSDMKSRIWQKPNRVYLGLLCFKKSLARANSDNLPTFSDAVKAKGIEALYVKQTFSDNSLRGPTLRSNDKPDVTY